ncbi:MerR family DNA-binding transcriptional regulator [Mesorhizobium sp. PAMC28654]|jgi:mannose-6-phosphate isomerase-like protein (cupin superfamily)|uniref:MerR family DNA-binding transcriptional regulator n=1 Tax=Mesorhizobium sp. PAMC28654 TaxID=2880934 RepID=UPI001D09ACB6|nr:MerR family DNA-binding transcriptional regulator [Mesorhizobium sp. PAMC28654]UDL90709.1 MerR family DNA-binding transcriptional regulator [Mesorhizobium sp. PAMC28654]
MNIGIASEKSGLPPKTIRYYEDIGVRVVEVGTGNADIPAYKSMAIVDVVFQPGAHAPATMMDNDMVCTITAGTFTIKKADKEFKLKEGDMYTAPRVRPTRRRTQARRSACTALPS